MDEEVLGGVLWSPAKVSHGGRSSRPTNKTNAADVNTFLLYIKVIFMDVSYCKLCMHLLIFFLFSVKANNNIKS